MLFLGALGGPTFADNWSQFHGPDGKGYVADAKIPSSWGDEDYAWRLELPSEDVGSPAIQAGKAFLLASDPAKATRRLLAVELASGKVLWQRSFDSQPHHLHLRNTYAASTPAVDAEHVYVAWSEPEHTFLKCFTHDGREVWSRDLGRWQSQHGFGTSPVLLDGKVILYDSQQGQQLRPGDAPGRSRMLALDPQTGATIWETPLSTTRVCYGVPALYQPAGGPQQIVATSNGEGAFGLDADTGKMLWNLEVFRSRCVSSPLVVGDLVIGSAGSGGGGNHLVAVRAVGGQPEEVYRLERAAPYVPTPAVAGDLMFVLADNGIVSCLEVNTGKPIWAKRLGGNFGASPVVLGDKLLVITLGGEATVLSASRDSQELGSFDLGGKVSATPAYSDGYLLLRVGNELRCLGPGVT